MSRSKSETALPRARRFFCSGSCLPPLVVAAFLWVRWSSLSPSRWYVFSFVSSVFSFFKFSCDVFLSHRIPVFLHQTPVVRATACWTPAAIGFDSGSSTFWSVLFLLSASSRQVQH